MVWPCSKFVLRVARGSNRRNPEKLGPKIPRNNDWFDLGPCVFQVLFGLNTSDKDFRSVSDLVPLQEETFMGTLALASSLASCGLSSDICCRFWLRPERFIGRTKVEGGSKSSKTMHNPAGVFAGHSSPKTCAGNADSRAR